KPTPPARPAEAARSGYRRVTRAQRRIRCVEETFSEDPGFAEAAGHSRTRGEGEPLRPCVPAPRFLTIPSCRSPARAAHGPGRTVSCRFARRRRGEAARGGRGRACAGSRSSPCEAAPIPTRERGRRAWRSPRPSGSGPTLSCLQFALPYPIRRKKHALGRKTRNQACLQLVAVLHQTNSRLRKTDAGVGHSPASRT